MQHYPPYISEKSSIPHDMGGWMRNCANGLVLCGTLVGAMTTYAKPVTPLEAACLLSGRVQEVRSQPLSELMVRVQLHLARDDNTVRNDVECSKQFRPGDTLWVSLNTRRIAPERKPHTGQRLWLSLRAGDDRQQQVWRTYEVIDSDEYLKRKNGIQ